ncbi:hypothetical protein IWX50DRAFT_656983 [Phyllosticta citricarpa]|uniref:Uncharacterized protein n=1 Tax=Phyllosticta citricarpa TaxID=55181 RepID=A0ABR1M803_9PEZI
MSWSGPSAGPSYQPAYGQPPYPQQPAYGQQPYAQPYHQQPYPGPPPAPKGHQNQSSKRKSNPVITRYPVPSYQHPSQSSQANPPHGSGQYPPQAYPPPAQNYPPHQGYQPPYQQAYQGYQTSPGYQQPAQGYQPPQGYPPGWHQPPTPYGYPQGQQPPADSAAYPPSGWPQVPQGPSFPPPPDPNATPTLADANPMGGEQTPRPPKSRRSTMTRNASIDPADLPESQRLYQSAAYTINLGLDDWDQSDYDGALWPKSNEPVNQDFSLGVIVWHPAEKISRALPSRFEDVQDWVGLDETRAIGNAESVSIYFGPENAHEAFLSIRQTEEWDSARLDSIFYQFTAKSDLIAVENVIANRDRPDLVEDEIRGPRVEELPDDDVEVKKEPEWDVMYDLDRALCTEQDGESKPIKKSRSRSPSQVPPRDDAQEQLLAALGVTGSPKPISNAPLPENHVPPPSFSHQNSDRRKSGGRRDSQRHFSDSKQPPPPPPAPFRNGNDAPNRNPSHSGPQHSQNSYPQSGPPLHNPNFSPPAPRPPLRPERSPSYDTWKSRRRSSTNGFGGRRSPAPSDSSQRTAAGSDFQMDESDPFNPNAPDSGHPPLKRSESGAGRKRSYDETEPGDPKQRQEDDYTPRIKRRQPRVAAAYGRR